MTLALRPIATALQYLGLFGSSAGLIASFVSQDYCRGSIYLVVGVIAVALDLVMIGSAARATAILAAVVKLVTTFTLAVGFVYSCAAPYGPLAPTLFDSSVGPTLILLSTIPSLLGAILRRVTR